MAQPLVAWCCFWAPGILSCVVGSDDCGGFLKNYSGWISYYKALTTNCVWTIEMKPGHKIILQILPLK